MFIENLPGTPNNSEIFFIYMIVRMLLKCISTTVVVILLMATIFSSHIISTFLNFLAF